MFNEPLGIYTDTAMFGEQVLIDGVVVNAIFDREYTADNAFGLAIANADPQLTIADKDLSPNIRNAEIVARGVAYAVAEIDFDGTGMSKIQLKAKNHDPRSY